jgi:hypothetical protein
VKRAIVAVPGGLMLALVGVVGLLLWRLVG